MTSKKRLFVSHSSRDQEKARKIVRGLRAAEYDVWYDEDNLGLGPLEPWFHEKIQTCQVFVILLSPDALASGWVQYELKTAQEWAATHGEPAIAPLVIEPCQVPPSLANYKYVAFDADFSPGDYVIELLNLLRATEEAKVAAAAQQTPPPQASPGPAPTTGNSYSVGNITGSGNVIQQGSNNRIDGTPPPRPGNLEK